MIVRTPLAAANSTYATEVCWLLEDRIGADAEATFVEGVYDDEFELEAITGSDLRRLAALVRRYANFPLGAVDAAVIAVAERFDAREIATLDHRHFAAVRPKHTDALTLLP